jgi:hypothetical protein
VRVVRQYLTDVREQKYTSAYGLLCDSLRGTMTEVEYTDRERTRPRITDFTIGTPSINGSEVLVSANVWDESGDRRYPTFVLVEEGEPPGLRICGGE